MVESQVQVDNEKIQVDNEPRRATERLHSRLNNKRGDVDVAIVMMQASDGVRQHRTRKMGREAQASTHWRMRRKWFAEGLQMGVP